METKNISPSGLGERVARLELTPKGFRYEGTLYFRGGLGDFYSPDELYDFLNFGTNEIDLGDFTAKVSGNIVEVYLKPDTESEYRRVGSVKIVHEGLQPLIEVEGPVEVVKERVWQGDRFGFVEYYALVVPIENLDWRMKFRLFPTDATPEEVLEPYKYDLRLRKSTNHFMALSS